MTAKAKATSDVGREDEDEITIERRVRVPAGFPAFSSGFPSFTSCVTTRMVRIDERLLALARGDDPEDARAVVIEPSVADEAETVAQVRGVVEDDPFGGLIPVYEENEAVPALPFPREPVSAQAVPRLRMRYEQLIDLEIDHRTGFLLSQIDGQRTIAELIDGCQLREVDALDGIDLLIALRAIELL